jgi:hypothetical protein
MNAVDPLQLERCIASLNDLCESIPECDAKGKLRGKLGRLQSAAADYRRDGDVGPLCQELSGAHAIVQRFHDAEPSSRMLQTLAALRQTIEQSAA